MVLSEDATLASILTQKTFPSCFQRSSRDSLLLPRLSMRKLSEERFFKSETPTLDTTTFSSGYHGVGARSLCQLGGQFPSLVHSTGNTDGETKLLTVTFSFKVNPKDLHKSNAFAKGPLLKSGMPEPQYLQNMIKFGGMLRPPASYPSDQLTTDFPCGIC